ncbi:hypothetical protein [Rhizobium leguminosarum]|uniref:hypothetical protein n=1 Tax=Rhizobium leguminosarum TaxID=384 RepID=UPI001FDFDAE0|nr:hypothetical protein [Rhizobium leguminosarum]
MRVSSSDERQSVALQRDARGRGHERYLHEDRRLPTSTSTDFILFNGQVDRTDATALLLQTRPNSAQSEQMSFSASTSPANRRQKYKQ